MMTVVALTATAGITAAGLTARTGGPGSTAPARPADQAAGQQAQSFSLDGYTIRVAPPLKITRGPHQRLTATLDGRSLRVSLMLYGAMTPAAAAARILELRLHSAGSVYVQKIGQTIFVYVPFHVAAQSYRSLVISAPGATRAELLRIAAAIAIEAGRNPTGGIPARPIPVRCPCG
jgi:hypothetical protein